MGARHITDEAICAALRDALGIQTLAAQKLGCDRSVIVQRIRKSAVVKEAADEAREVRLDLAESKLFAGVNEGAPWAIKYLLSTQGGSRGYKEQQVVEVRPAAPDLSAIPTSEIERIVAERDRRPQVDGGQ